MLEMRAATKKFIIFLMLSSSCAIAQDNIDMLIVDYPHGEDRLHVKRTGEAYLYYAARPSAQVIRKDSFTVQELYDTFEQHLHPNVPREMWPDPNSEAGMVSIRYMDGMKEDYLIFDLKDIADVIFDTAKRNVIRVY